MAQLTFELRGTELLIRRLRTFQEIAFEKSVEGVRATGASIRARAAELSPVDTGRMRRLIREDYSPDGLSGFVGWHLEDFEAEGEDLYPVFVEFGTRKMAAQPTLAPAAGEAERGFVDAVRKAMDEAVRGAARRAGP